MVRSVNDFLPEEGRPGKLQNLRVEQPTPADCRAITASQIPDVLQEWRTPEHEAFRPRNAWSLFNAFTSVYRETNPHTALRRGEALHGLFDAVVGLS